MAKAPGPTTFSPAGVVIAEMGAVDPIRSGPGLPSDFRRHPDWDLFQFILAELYQEVLDRYLMAAATPARIEVIRRDLAAVNINLCREAGLDRSQLALQTDVIVDPEPPHGVNLDIGASGAMAGAFRGDGEPLFDAAESQAIKDKALKAAQEFEAAVAPSEPEPPPGPLEWGGWPLGAPEDEG